MDPNNPFANLSPEDLQQLVGLGSLNQQDDLLQQQLAMAEHLRNRPQTQGYGALGGVGAGLANAFSGIEAGLDKRSSLPGLHENATAENAGRQNYATDFARRQNPAFGMAAPMTPTPNRLADSRAGMVGQPDPVMLAQARAAALQPGQPAPTPPGLPLLAAARAAVARGQPLTPPKPDAAAPAAPNAPADPSAGGDASFYGQEGLLASLSGDRVLAPFGHTAIQYANQQQERDGQKLQRLIEQNRNNQMADFHRDEVAARNTQIGLERERLEQGRWNHFTLPDGRIFKQDAKSGEVFQVGGADAGEPAGGDGAPKPPPATPKQLAQDWKDFGRSISSVTGKGNLSADQQKRLDALSRVEDLALDENGGIRPLNPQQYGIFATDVASAIGGGTPTEAQIKEQNPHTWRGDLASTLQWATAHPQDAGAQAFIRSTLDALHTIKGGIQQTMLSHQTQALPNFYHLRQYDQPRFDSMLQAAGVDPQAVDEHGIYGKKPARTQPTVRAPANLDDGAGVPTNSAPAKTPPVRVKQNGVWFVRNPSTGKYEPETVAQK